MAPGYEALSDHDFDDEEELDFSDLREQFAVKMDEGLDAFVVVDGLPIVSVEQKPKLVKFLLKKLNTVGKTTEDAIFMPMDDNNQSEGFAFVEYGSPEQALAATKHLHGTALDKKHTLAVNKVTDIEKYGREGKIDDEYTPPDLAPFQEKPHLKAWLGDPDARDQFLVFHGDNVSLYWNEKQNDPQQVFDRKHWTQLFTQWSPLGTYAATMHQQGVQLWGGPDFLKQRQFAHPFVSLIEFSPGENYLTTWSNQPIVVDESDKGPLSIEEDGKNILIWDITTGKVLRSFVSYDLPAQPGPDGVVPPKGKVQWPAFKWSADEKFVARMKPKESLSIYELPRMNLLDRTSIKIDGIVDFEWSPATPQRAGVKAYEQLLCYWTPEILSNPAKVCLMSVPSKEIVRALPLYNVTDAKLHWQSAGAYCCVKVDRQKSKKSLATNLEIFRIREKNIPCEVVDNLKDTVINFAWEPKGDRFVLITAGEAVPGSNVAPKTAVSFFCPEKVKGAVGNFKLIRTIEKKNNNGIYWSPKGRFVVVGTIAVAQFSDLDFWDLDYEGDKPESEANLSANLMLMNTVEHYGVTDVEWDPTGRYVTTSVSVWTNPVENGYRLWTFSGQMLADAPTEKLKQFLWRPRPANLLSKEEQKTIRRNLRDYSREFDEIDKEREEGANAAVVEQRRREYAEWFEFIDDIRAYVKELREEEGRPDPEEELELQRTKSSAGGDEVVEEMVEELLEETEEFA